MKRSKHSPQAATARPFPLPLRVEAGDSPRLRLLLAALHVAAALGVWLADLALALQLGLSTALGFSLARHTRPRQRVVLRAHADGRLEQARDETWIPLTCLPQTTLLPGLIVLRVRAPGTRWPHTLLLAEDAMHTDDARRLRVWLRWLAQPQA